MTGDPMAEALEAGRKRAPGGGRKAVVAAHKYRAEIEVLLVAGWAPAHVNQRLRQMFPDYESVSERALDRLRRGKLRNRLPALVQYEAELKDEHALIDTVKGRAALVALQRGRLQKTLDLEAASPKGILARTRAEIDLLAKLYDGYEEALQLAGFGAKAGLNGVAAGILPPTDAAQMARDALEDLRAQLADLPEPARGLMVAALEAARKARLDARVKAVEAEVQRTLPAPRAKDAAVTIVEIAAGPAPMGGTPDPPKEQP